MNKFVNAIKGLDLEAVKELIAKDPKWLAWKDAKGRNALHFLCGVNVGADAAKADSSLKMLKFFLSKGMDIDTVHLIPDENCGYFRATPLWYAYTRGRNEKLYRYLLENCTVRDNCWWAMAWYDDVEAAELFIDHGGKLDGLDALFLGAVQWKRYTFAEWLLEKGADINTSGTDGNNALIVAVKRKDEDFIRMLLHRGADPEKKNDNGVSVREMAATKSSKRINGLLNEDVKL